MAFTNSPLADQNPAYRSPFYTPGRTLNGVTYTTIDGITLHMTEGHINIPNLAAWFQKPSVRASSNYGIDDYGNRGMFVEEKNTAWTSSSSANDVRAITVEISSDKTAPYRITDAAIESAIELCIDICQRNGIKKMYWIPDKEWALNKQKNHAPGEAVFTVHRWFYNKQCPGEYLYTKMAYICGRVNAALGALSIGEEVTMKVTDIKEDGVYGIIKGGAQPVPPTPPTPPEPAKIVVGSKVTINPGAKAGGMNKTYYGKPISSQYANGKYIATVVEIAVHDITGKNPVEEAKLDYPVWSWVATSSLTLVQ